MIIPRLLAALLAVGSLHGFAYAQADIAESKSGFPASTTPPYLLDGDYLITSYIDELMRSHSPYTSHQKTKPGLSRVMSISVRRTVAGPSFGFGWNFHEGDSLRQMSGDRKFINYETGSPEEAIGISIKSSTAFLLTGRKEVAGEFQRVGSVTRFINEQTVVGHTPTGGASFMHLSQMAARLFQRKI